MLPACKHAYRVLKTERHLWQTIFQPKRKCWRSRCWPRAQAFVQSRGLPAFTETPVESRFQGTSNTASTPSRLAASDPDRHTTAAFESDILEIWVCARPKKTHGCM